ncbi:MAG: type II toxin-antitoxin system VapC family toxin [Candidatus Kapabacteria bacterium]|jgi:predicted nucleic acid-binding protein|nr:type II toxin-antitoxin system VapC family toxin [Candidatus Kapabacteria bacterium]
MESRIVMDSSVWVEFYMGNPAIKKLVIEHLRNRMVVVPSICLYEVSLAVERRIGEDMVKVAVANMQEQIVDDLTASRATAAAQIRNERKLAMADSLVYAATLAHGATLLTQDRDFEGLPNVRYIKGSF